MTLLLLTMLAAEPAAPPAPPPEPEKIEVPAPAPAVVPPPIPPADVSPEITREDESLGFTLFRTLVVLGLVVMLAYVSLNWGLRKVLGIKAPMGGSSSIVSVIERVPLDQRHALFLVKAAGEYLLVGGADASLTLVSKLDTAEVEKLRAEKPQATLQLSPFLQKLLGRKGAK